MNQSKIQTGKMVRLAVLVAIILLLEITNLGFLKFGPVSITIMMVPVIIGAIILGPTEGAILGLIFGLTSFSQAFGKDALGALLLAENPFFLFLMCVVPRVFAGWLPGLAFRALNRWERLPLVGSVAVTALLGTLTNTVLFIAALWLFWHNAAAFTDIFGAISLFKLFAILIVTNTIIEAVINIVVGTAIGSSLRYFMPVQGKAAA
jgi:uncharacterized membrane protein